MIKKILFALLALFAAAAFAAVDVNKADQASLESIKGIGPAISSNIIDERKKGAFKDWTDLVDRVKGIGETNAAKFSTEGLTVNGSAFKGAPAKPAAAEAKATSPKKEDKPAAADAKTSEPTKKASAAKEDKPAKPDAKAAEPAKESTKKADKPAKADAKASEPTVAKADKKTKKADKASAADDKASAPKAASTKASAAKASDKK